MTQCPPEGVPIAPVVVPGSTPGPGAGWWADQRGPIRQWTFEITFHDRGVRASVFTFG
jgi:hypothetical protein